MSSRSRTSRRESTVETRVRARRSEELFRCPNNHVQHHALVVCSGKCRRGFWFVSLWRATSESRVTGGAVFFLVFFSAATSVWTARAPPLFAGAAQSDVYGRRRHHERSDAKLSGATARLSSTQNRRPPRWSARHTRHAATPREPHRMVVERRRRQDVGVWQCCVDREGNRCIAAR